jgi:FKBP-type peptidyl-prolyl cis-trans isomerase
MPRRLAATVALLASLLASAACLGSTEPDQPRVLADPATVTYAPALDVDLAGMTRTSTGLYYRDVVTGAASGAVATTTDSVAINYAGYLNTGEQVAASRAGAPSEARLSRLIAGFGLGVAGMRPGGKRKLVIPPHLGFVFTPQVNPNTGVVEIPANSVLVFDVELVAIR